MTDFEQRLLQRLREESAAGRCFTPEDGVNFQYVRSAYTGDNILRALDIRRTDGVREPLLAKRLLPEKTAPEAPEREYAMLSRFHGYAPLLAENCIVPKPCCLIEDLRTVVMERIAGRRLTDCLRAWNGLFDTAGAKRLAEIMERAGRCLGILHGANGFGEPGSMPENEITYLFDPMGRALKAVGRGRVVSAGDSAALAALLDRARTRLGTLEMRRTMVHGDFYAGNILVREGALCLIDFAFSRPAAVQRDLGHFLHFLDIVNPYPENLLYDFRRLHTFKKLFLDGYFGPHARIGAVDRLLIALYALRAVLLHCRRRRQGARANLRGRMYFAALARRYNRILRIHAASARSALAELA